MTLPSNRTQRDYDSFRESPSISGKSVRAVVIENDDPIDVEITNQITITIDDSTPIKIDVVQNVPQKLLGRDGNFTADVFEEDGVAKLQVKATSVPDAIGNLFFEHAKNNGSPEMNVNGNGQPVDFVINSDSAADVIVESLAFEAFASNIRVDKFLSINSELSTGIILEIKSNDTTFQFLPITTTQEFDSHFAFGSGRSFQLIFASGSDSMVSRFGPTNPFIIKKTGTFTTDDYIKVTINDNISQISKLNFLAFGSRDL